MQNSNQSSTVWQVEFRCPSSVWLSLVATSKPGRRGIKRFEFLLLQRGGKELNGALPGVGGIVGTVCVFVDGVFKTVSSIGVNGDVHLLPKFLHCLRELLNIVGRDSTVLTAEEAEYGSVNRFQ